jgi:predicted naringenin-chalcone synthase
MAAGIVSVGSAVPELYVPQKQAFEYFVELFDLEPREKELYRRILCDGYIDGRYIAMDRPEEAAVDDPDALNLRFIKYGRALGAQAARRALEAANCDKDSLVGLVVNTCTGYACPGLTSYLVEDLGLRDDIHVRDVMGMGCGGALPNLATAVGIHETHHTKGPVLSVAVEICTATIFMDPDPGIVVSNSIFGDGAAAAVIDSVTEDNSIAEILDFETIILPGYRKELMYRTEQHRLRNVLSRRVPAISGKAIEQLIHRILGRNQLVKNDIAHWIIHPGGTEILQSLERNVGLSSDQLKDSYDILKTHGNMSSPSVLFVMEKTLRENAPASGSYGLMIAFGAGFSAYATLIKF